MDTVPKQTIEKDCQHRSLDLPNEGNTLRAETNQKIEENDQNNLLKLSNNQNKIGMKRSSEVQHEPLKKRRETEKRPPKEERYDLHAHFPKIDKSHSVRCKNENCKLKSYVFCVKCKVHLCLSEERNCFMDFHLIKKTNVSPDCHSNS